MQGFICGPRIYKYDGWIFEQRYCGPWPLDSEGEPLDDAGPDFWAMIARFEALSDAERATSRVGGGCVELRDG